MKLNQLLFVFIVFGLLGTTSDLFAEKKMQQQDPLNLIRPLVQKEMAKGKRMGVAVGIVRGTNSYFEGFGETKKGTGIKPTEATVFEIGSVTKTFTALVLASYLNNGRLKLSDPVHSHLPEDIVYSDPRTKQINFKHLATHTSGLSRMPGNWIRTLKHISDPYIGYERSHLYSCLGAYRLTGIPGKSVVYSNYGSGLLGHILERISGKSYENLLTSTLLQPLGMSDTRFSFRQYPSNRLAQGYMNNGKETRYWEWKVLAGAGVLKSTIPDMLIYLKLQLGQLKDQPELTKAAELSHKKQFKSKKGVSLGLNWHISELSVKGKKTPYKLVWHNGATGGFCAFAAFVKSEQIGVVLLTNQQNFIDALGMQLMETLLSSKMKLKK